MKSLQEGKELVEREYEERQMQLDKVFRSKQTNFMAVKQANMDRERELEEQIKFVKLLIKVLLIPFENIQILCYFQNLSMFSFFPR